MSHCLWFSYNENKITDSLVQSICNNAAAEKLHFSLPKCGSRSTGIYNSVWSMAGVLAREQTKERQRKTLKEGESNGRMVKKINGLNYQKTIMSLLWVKITFASEDNIWHPLYLHNITDLRNVALGGSDEDRRDRIFNFYLLTVEWYQCQMLLIFCHDCQVNRRYIASALQSNVPGICACTYLVGHCGAFPDDIAL